MRLARACPGAVAGRWGGGRPLLLLPPPLLRRPPTPLLLANPIPKLTTTAGSSPEQQTRRCCCITHYSRGGDGKAANAANADAARLLTSRLARCRSASEVREALASSHELNATHVAAAMAACARIAKATRTRRRRREDEGDGDDGPGAEHEAARLVAEDLYARLRVVVPLEGNAYGLSMTSASSATTKTTPITLRDAASILASAAALGVGGGGGGNGNKTNNSRTSLALLDAASRAGGVNGDDRSSESVALALWAAARMRLPAPETDDDTSGLLSRLLLLPPSSSTHAATTLIALADLLPRWQREQANARRQKRRGAEQEASPLTPPHRLTLPPGWLDSTLRATLPLLEVDDQNDDEDAEKEDDFMSSSLLVAAAALAPFSEPEKRRRRHHRALTSISPPWWASAWLLAAERNLPDASAAQLTRTFDALATSGALDAWPVDDDESDDNESDDDNSTTTTTSLRHRQVRFMRAAYGQLYYTADQFSPKQLGLLLSKGALGAAAPPLSLATRLAAYALAKAAAVVKKGQASTANEVRDAVSGVGYALKGLADVYSGKKKRRRRKGKAPPPPQPPLDPRLLLAARAAVLEPGVDVLLLAKGQDDDATNAVVDLLAGMAALKRVIGEDDDGDEDRPLPSIFTLLSQSGSSRLSPQQLSSLLDALVDLNLLSAPIKPNTPTSLWLRQLLRASALRLRACRDVWAVVSVAASVARLCSSGPSSTFHPGRSWTLRTLMPAVASAVGSGARLGAATTTTTLLLRSLAVLLTPLAVDSSSATTKNKLPFDRARLVAQLRAAVDRGGTGAAAAASGTTPPRRSSKQREEDEELRMRRDLAAVEAALEKLG